MAEKYPRFYGLAVECDPNGRILRVFHNDFSGYVELKAGKSLSAVIDDNSMQKYFNFLYHLRTEKLLLHWHINVRRSSTVMEFFFNGELLGQKALVVASASKKAAAGYFNSLRQYKAEGGDVTDAADEQHAWGDDKPDVIEEGEWYGDFTRLNNELANLQRDVQKKNYQLQRALEERDKYVGMAAHDLRNPLGAVAGISSLLLEGELGDLNEEQTEYLQMIKQSANHMLKIVNSMLDLSALQNSTLQLNRETADLPEVINRSMAINRLMARKKDIHLVLESAVEELALEIDTVKILQVMDNLLSNAVKYSHPHTRVTVRLFKGETAAIVEVHDEGQGIPEKELPKLFMPFSQLSVRTTAGEASVGLGLAICRRIIEGHSGAITAESEPGKGSTFRFTLPL